MEVLTIGNSFSEDATRYLHDIAKNVGEEISVVNLSIGGCTLERHYRNMLSDQRDYALFYNGYNTGFRMSIKEALFSRNWDVVTIQQASHMSNRYENYMPFATEIVKYIRKAVPQAKLYVHQTWSYEEGSQRLLDMGYDTTEKMFFDIERAYSKLCCEVDADGIIPSGKMLDELFKRGIDKLHRDPLHASYGIGRYALGLLWYRVLTGRTVAYNKFDCFDEPILESHIKTVKEYVDSVKPLA